MFIYMYVLLLAGTETCMVLLQFCSLIQSPDHQNLLCSLGIINVLSHHLTIGLDKVNTKKKFFNYVKMYAQCLQYHSCLFSRIFIPSFSHRVFKLH